MKLCFVCYSPNVRQLGTWCMHSPPGSMWRRCNTKVNKFGVVGFQVTTSCVWCQTTWQHLTRVSAENLPAIVMGSLCPHTYGRVWGRGHSARTGARNVKAEVRASNSLRTNTDWENSLECPRRLSSTLILHPYIAIGFLQYIVCHQCVCASCILWRPSMPCCLPFTLYVTL